MACCSPCGKAAYPHKRQMFTHEYIESKAPLFDMLETERKMKLRIGMENKSHNHKIHQNAKFKLNQHLQDSRTDLENRRDRLKTMMEDEIECWRREIVNQFENSQASRIDEMRARVGALREQREEHQKKFVEHKLDQAFQSQCEQMRTLLSNRMCREITKDWGEQIAQKQRLECEEQEEERMWTRLCLEDSDEKLRREEAWQAVRDAATRRGLEELQKQVEYKKMRAADADKIRARELAMIDADIAAMKAEKQKLIDEKNERFERAKAHAKDMMETRDYYRDRKLKREEIVAREFLKKAVRELYVEQEDRGKKKRDLMRAIETYRDYLQKRDCLENAKEEAVQRIIDGVIEQQHEKVMASRKREHEQRRQLFQNVLAGRTLQIQDLEKKRAFEEEQRIKEMELLKEDWKKYMQDLRNEKQERIEKQQQYRCDLNSQVAYNHKLRARELDEVKREDELCDLEEHLFNHRLQKTLHEANLTMSNPYRQPLVGKNVRQCLRPV